MAGRLPDLSHWPKREYVRYKRARNFTEMLATVTICDYVLRRAGRGKKEKRKKKEKD